MLITWFQPLFGVKLFIVRTMLLHVCGGVCVEVLSVGVLGW